MERPANLETTSLGAAYAAGIGIGHWTAKQLFDQSATAKGATQFQPKVGLPPLQVEVPFYDILYMFRRHKYDSDYLCRKTRLQWTGVSSFGIRLYGLL